MKLIFLDGEREGEDAEYEWKGFNGTPLERLTILNKGVNPFGRVKEKDQCTYYRIMYDENSVSYALDEHYVHRAVMSSGDKETALKDQISRIFSYHKPGGTQAARYGRLRHETLKFATLIEDTCPESRERSLAITNLQQAVMWANASIAINEEPI